jgi:hypothetical protein
MLKVNNTYALSFLVLLFVACVNSEQQPASIIPLPQSLEWTNEGFDVNTCKGIIVKTPSLKKEAKLLQQMLAKKGNKVDLLDATYPEKHAIVLQLDTVRADYLAEEAYRLQVNGNGIRLRANSAHGIFNGLQTLFQLMEEGSFMRGCDIVDSPAYKWRGYMVDVGRNYQSLKLLKQQIDQMARYKLNVFHFHLTEDVAWRLQIKQYPQLTAAKHMLRNKGQFYSIAQVKELIEYCRERYITLVPEIDMPGHSAAFSRAMGVDMQSEKGFQIVKNIMEEICSTYDLPYIHIGADEVKIKNPQFLPEITQLIQRHQKKVIGWAPGGNYDDQTIRQLWKDEANQENEQAASPYIDSKFLYISDFDPLSTVVTIFNRQLGGKPRGDSQLLGAEFCLWNDRRVARESDLLSMNAVYPAMLAFAERSWRGGGYPGVVFSIGADSSDRAKAFVDFEKRLLDHRHRYFAKLPFNYVKQTHIKWKLFGPFENNGDLSTTYWPESRQAVLDDSAASLNATGGTIWLWHTHGPPVKAWLPAPKENTTWYAYTKFWSDVDSAIAIWADFKDLSKSGADATPPIGEWDYMQSKLWVNGKLTAPPKWTFPGRPAGQLEAPLVDEGFYYRPPQILKVKKGWNKVLVKLPMASFDPLLDWQVPPKWMFTFIPVYREEGGINYSSMDIRFEPNN